MPTGEQAGPDGTPPKALNFDEDFIMGSNDKILHLHIWGLEGV